MTKRILTLALAFVLALALIPIAPSVIAADEIIRFPDPNFEAVVREKIDKKTGDIKQSDVAEVTFLYACGYDISDLTGIEYFTALTSLWCADNQLSSFDLSRNTALTELLCNNNQLTAIDISRNVELKNLWCGENQLSTLDVSHNTKLTDLLCSENQLTILDLSNNTALSELWCTANQLTTLDVSNNTALMYLLCSDNMLETLDVSRNTELIWLYCNNNYLTELDVSRNIKLTSLLCDYNQLTTLDVSHNIALDYLAIQCNRLTTLDVSHNTVLTGLACTYNQLTALDISKNLELSSLNCQHNKLMALDVSRNTSLTELYCGGNELTSLDLSNNTALTRLSCDDNYFSSETALMGLNKDKLVDFRFDPQNILPIDTAAPWARDGIKGAVDKGFVPEDLQNNYDYVITRAEFCRMALMWMEYKTGQSIYDILYEKDLWIDFDTFCDTSDYYILAAYSLGITTGTIAPTATSPGQFSPDKAFTREEAATMIRNTCKAAGMDISNVISAGFEDIDLASCWAVDGINFCNANGIMQGTSKSRNIFNPKGTFTRQESIITFNNIE